jgi:hypothetical protein
LELLHAGFLVFLDVVEIVFGVAEGDAFWDAHLVLRIRVDGVSGVGDELFRALVVVFEAPWERGVEMQDLGGEGELVFGGSVIIDLEDVGLVAFLQYLRN